MWNLGRLDPHAETSTEPLTPSGITLIIYFLWIWIVVVFRSNNLKYFWNKKKYYYYVNIF